MGPLSDMQYVGDRNVGTWRMTDCIPPQPRHVSTSPNSWQILRNIVRSSLRTQQKTGGEFTEYAGGGKRNSCMEIWREGPSTWPLSVPPSTATAIWAQNTELGRILIQELFRTDTRPNFTVITLRKVRRCRILRKSQLGINMVKYTGWFKRLHIYWG